MTRPLAARLGSGDTVFAAWVGSPEPLVAEACARAGYDAVTLDMQHGLITLDAVMRSIAAARLAGAPVVVRIPFGEYATASRVLDMGADGVIAPMIDGAGDAARFAGAMKYPPLGMRSYGPHRAATLRGVGTAGYFATANGETVSLAMIETRGALAALDAILADPGIDGVFVGPADLSLQISGGAGIDVDRADNLAAIDHVAARAGAAGKIPAIFAPTGRHARLYADKGYRFVAVGTDGELLAIGARTLLAEARGQTKAAPPSGDAAPAKDSSGATAY